MDIQQIIKDRYKELPAEIKQAIENTDLAGKFTAIAEKHSLRVDQNGALQTETLLVMLGLEPTDDYVDNVQKSLDISRNEAQSIAEDVNTEILGSIRVSIRALEEKERKEENPPATPNIPINPIPVPPKKPTPTPLTPIEKAGDFTIENDPVSASLQYNDTRLKKENVLNDLENIEKLKPESANAFVEHLLSNPVSNPTQTEVRKETVPTPPTKETPKKYTADPYREQF